MLGCEIDFIVKGLDAQSRSVVASRKEAMLKKHQIFYLDRDASGNSKIYEDRIVQARGVAAAEKVNRAEIFGVETSILARDLSYYWLGDARERFHVGEHILVRILSVTAESRDKITVKVDVKSVEGNTIAHSCYDSRTVGKKDEVSFVVTHIDEERNVAVGLISRIIRQNL